MFIELFIKYTFCTLNKNKLIYCISRYILVNLEYKKEN